MAKMFMDVRVAGPVLQVAATGEVSVQEAKELYTRMLDEHVGAGTRAILIDCRELKGVLTMMQRYELGVQMFDGHLRMIEAGRVPPRIAVVAVPPLFDPGMMMESVAVNRGAQFRAVQSLEEAARWLEIDPALLPGRGETP